MKEVCNTSQFSMEDPHKPLVVIITLKSEARDFIITWVKNSLDDRNKSCSCCGKNLDPAEPKSSSYLQFQNSNI